MIRIAVSGACGRTGSLIVKNLGPQEDMKLVTAIMAPTSPKVGLDIGEALGIGKMEIKITDAGALEKILGEERPDILVDYTEPEASVSIVKATAKLGIKFVIGTTGHSSDQMAEIKNTITANRTSAVISSNMTMIFNLLFKLAGISAQILGEDYDVELVDLTERQVGEIPTPTGTAMALAEAIAVTFGKNTDDITVYGRPRGLEKIQDERPRGQICIHAIRAGSGVGYHEVDVILAGPSQRLVLAGRTDGPTGIAEGTFKAVRFLSRNQEPGRIYNMLDVLGLR